MAPVYSVLHHIAPAGRYVDFWLMLRAMPSLDPACRRAGEWHATHALYGAFREIQQLFPHLDERLSTAAAGLLPARTRRFLDDWVLPGAEGLRVTKPRRRGVQLWRKFWLMDSGWRRASFALHFGYAVTRGRWLEWRPPNAS